jgi:hypothetical protein
MTPMVHPGDGTGKPAVRKSEWRAFHGGLATRSNSGQSANRRRRNLLRLADRWGWLGPFLVQGATFAGGLALGGGLVLIGRGEEWRSRSGVMIGVGVACVLFGLLSQLIVKGITRRGTSVVRS